MNSWKEPEWLELAERDPVRGFLSIHVSLPADGTVQWRYQETNPTELRKYVMDLMKVFAFTDIRPVLHMVPETPVEKFWQIKQIFAETGCSFFTTLAWSTPEDDITYTLPDHWCSHKDFTLIEVLIGNDLFQIPPETEPMDIQALRRYFSDVKDKDHAHLLLMHDREVTTMSPILDVLSVAKEAGLEEACFGVLPSFEEELINEP
jgi:hypothetical protein